MSLPEDLLRANLRGLTPYQSARRIGGRGHIWLNANEHHSAPAITPGNSPLNRYPEPQPAAVLDAYARYLGVAPENLLITRGGDEGIELLIRTFSEPGTGSILYNPPTYGMYAVSAATHGVHAIAVPQTADYQLDLEGISAALFRYPRTSLVYICNPNNPTGTRLRRDDLHTLLAMTRLGMIVVIDEAYSEYSPADSLVPELARYPNLAIIRTLSKAHALAGIRCGFVVANPALIACLHKTIAPYPVPTPVADIAAQALSPAGIAQMQARVAETVAARDALAAALARQPQVRRVYDSAANYLLVAFHDGEAVFRHLADAGIILRDQHHVPGLANHIRITIGSADENAAVLQALDACPKAPLPLGEGLG